jgi:hypothetical protein
MLQIYVSLKNHSPLKSCDVPEKLQLELIELQYNSILHSSFNQEASITFYASLPVVSWLSQFWQNLSNVFGSTYKCKQAFSHMKQNRSKFHSRDMTWCKLAFQKWNQMSVLLWSKCRLKLHINKESLGYFDFNVHVIHATIFITLPINFIILEYIYKFSLFF